MRRLERASPLTTDQRDVNARALPSEKRSECCA
jgi:hypothetical protein